MKRIISIGLFLMAATLACSSGRVIVVAESETRPGNTKSEQGRAIAAQKHVDRGVKYLDRGKYEKARKEFSIAIELDPQNYEAHYYLGLTYYRWRKYDDGIDYFRVAIRLHPDDPVWVSQVRIHLGLSFEYIRKYERAEREFYAALTLDPTNREARHCWERVKYRHHNDDEDDDKDEDDHHENHEKDDHD